MQFGYFTLSDNRYPDNPRSAERFVQDIYAEALYAEEVGLNSAWIGEHHFNLLGCNASPHMLLAQLAGATKRIRLAPAVTLLPVRHPLQVAEDWATLDLLSGGRVDFAAGRGYDRMEYEPFGAPFMDSAELFAEGMDVLWKAWTTEGRWSHHGRFYSFDDIEVRPRPLQRPLRPYVATFSRFSMELAAKNDWNIIFAPFAAAMVYGSLADGVAAYRDLCERQGRSPRRAMCSYFIHLGDTQQELDYGREALIRYFKEALIAAFPSDATADKTPPSLAYFREIVRNLERMEASSLTSRSILVGNPDQVAEDLRAIERAGIDEVILYFNYGRKPHAMVKEQMDRFAREVMVRFDQPKAT